MDKSIHQSHHSGIRRSFHRYDSNNNTPNNNNTSNNKQVLVERHSNIALLIGLYIEQSVQIKRMTKSLCPMTIKTRQLKETFNR